MARAVVDEPFEVQPGERVDFEAVCTLHPRRQTSLGEKASGAAGEALAGMLGGTLTKLVRLIVTDRRLVLLRIRGTAVPPTHEFECARGAVHVEATGGRQRPWIEVVADGSRMRLGLDRGWAWAWQRSSPGARNRDELAALLATAPGTGVVAAD